jgi:hypothetical protein
MNIIHSNKKIDILREYHTITMDFLSLRDEISSEDDQQHLLELMEKRETLISIIKSISKTELVYQQPAQLSSETTQLISEIQNQDEILEGLVKNNLTQTKLELLNLGKKQGALRAYGHLSQHFGRNIKASRYLDTLR